MLKTILQKATIGTVAATASCFGLTGVAAAYTGHDYGNTSSRYSNTRTNVDVLNNNYQHAKSGGIYLMGGMGGNSYDHSKDHGSYDKKHDYKHKDQHGGQSNSRVGDIKTGDAKNYNQSDFMVSSVNKSKPEMKLAGYDKEKSYAPHSKEYKRPTHNKPSSHNNQQTTTDVNVNNINDQYAKSGGIYLNGGSGGSKSGRSSSSVGDISTGNASNYNETQIDVAAANKQSSPSYELAGHHKPTRSNSRTTTDTNVSIDNFNNQAAQSGSVFLSGGGSGSSSKHGRSSSTVGDVSTGNATNYNSTEISVVVL